MSDPDGVNPEAWKTWLEERKAMGKPIKTQRAATLNANKLRPYSWDEQMRMVDQSIEHGWTGLYPLKKNRDKPANVYADMARPGESWDDLFARMQRSK